MGENVALRWPDVPGTVKDPDGEADVLIRNTAHCGYKIYEDSKYH